MKILQVIPYFTPKRGGDVNVCYNLSKQLVRRGHEVKIITTDFEFDKEYAESIEREGVVVLPFHCIANIGLFLISLSMKNWLRGNIKKFDIIHMHNFRSFQNSIVHHYARKYKIPYILQAHGSTPRIMEKQMLKKVYDWLWGYRILRDASRLIAVSREEVEQYTRMGIDYGKISVVYNGLDVSLFKNLPEYGKFKEKYYIKTDYIVLFVGRIHKIKGLDFLIRSFSELRKERDDVTLVIAGPDYGYKNELEKLISRLNLKKKVNFVGYLSDPLSAYVDADVLVYPAIYEIFGLVPFESIMCGTPVIVTGHSGCGELVKKSGTAYLVHYGDINGLKEKMKWVIEKPEEGHKLIEKGKKYITENLAWNKIVRSMEASYNMASNR